MQRSDELPGEPTTAALDAERRERMLELERSEARLTEQSWVFVPLIALALIVAMPIWAKSLDRFLKLLASPFVLLPIGFCIAHLVISWRKIIRMRNRLREIECAEARDESSKSHRNKDD